MSLSPNEGPSTGGTMVTLTGTNLGDVTAVRFGGTGTALTIVSATQITATAPTGSAGAVQVTVTSPGGTSAGLTYTRTALPGI
ncbi:IPT/TIG domain-containing protein [Streptomyces sp. NPDC056663]|uniref:IPT/TIG domain-containing protein n=1 Tax=Streptomyces sp. NPDC056663 TaxID=3345899 RepID=UPI0036B7F24E